MRTIQLQSTASNIYTEILRQHVKSRTEVWVMFESCSHPETVVQDQYLLQLSPRAHTKIWSKINPPPLGPVSDFRPRGALSQVLAEERPFILDNDMFCDLSKYWIILAIRGHFCLPISFCGCKCIIRRLYVLQTFHVQKYGLRAESEKIFNFLKLLNQNSNQLVVEFLLPDTQYLP